VSATVNKQTNRDKQTASAAKCNKCVLLCFINPILANRYGPGVFSCQQTSDNHKSLSGVSHLYIVTSSHEPTSGHVMLKDSKDLLRTDVTCQEQTCRLVRRSLVQALLRDSMSRSTSDSPLTVICYTKAVV